MKVLLDHRGNAVTLDPTGMAGAESEIFRVRGQQGTLAAVSLAPYSADREKVVRELVTINWPPYVFGPKGLLMEGQNLAGFTMTEAAGTPLSTILIPAEAARLGLNSPRARLEIAKAIVDTSTLIFETSVDVVDNNPANWLIEGKLGSLRANRIDLTGAGVTAGHVSIPASANLRLEYLPSELVGEFKSGGIRTWGEGQATGALAMLLFHVLTGGSVFSHSKSGTPEDFLANKTFAIFSPKCQSPNRLVTAFNDLDHTLQKFLEMGINGPSQSRPTFQAWENLFDALLKKSPAPQSTAQQSVSKPRRGRQVLAGPLTAATLQVTGTSWHPSVNFRAIFKRKYLLVASACLIACFYNNTSMDAKSDSAVSRNSPVGINEFPKRPMTPERRALWEKTDHRLPSVNSAPQKTITKRPDLWR